MQKNTSTKYVLSLLSNSLVITVVAAAIIHTLLAVLAVFAKHHIYFINPIRILGVNYFWPTYQNSDSATLIAWLTLVCVYSAVAAAYIRIYDPGLVMRLRRNFTYNQQTKRVTYETRRANEIDVIPLSLLLKHAFRVRDIIQSINEKT